MPDPAQLGSTTAPSTAVPTCAACQNPPVVQWQRRSATDPTHTVPVYACVTHAIDRDAAAHVHAVGCTAPDPATVPACNCTPEPLPAGSQVVVPDPTTLPTGWVVSSPPAS